MSTSMVSSLIEDCNGRSMLRLDDGCCCADLDVVHGVLVDTNDVDLALGDVDDLAVVTHDTTIGSPITECFGRISLLVQRDSLLSFI